jgi:membrane fusion protein
MGLFRQQAVEAYCDRLRGHVILLPRHHHSLLSVALLLWLALVVVFLTQASFSRKETVVGWLEPTAGVVRVYPQSEGRLARILVGDGEHVSKGQPLAVINGDRILSDGQHLEALLLDEYDIQKQALQRQLQRSGELSTNRQQDLLERLAAARDELRWLENQQETQEKRQAIMDKRLGKLNLLKQRGHVTESEIDLVHEQRLELTAELQQFAIQHRRQLALIAQLQMQQKELPTSTANDRDQLLLELSNLSQEIARLRGTRAYILKATIEGTVSAVRLKVGQRANPNRALLSLLPRESGLVAQLLVPVRSAGFLQTGQSLTIRYDAFPHQKFGTYTGVIRSVATTASLPEDNGTLPLSLSEPVYRVRAELDASQISAYGSHFPLKAGMTLSADIQLERRSLVQWLLDPLYSLRGRLT